MWRSGVYTAPVSGGSFLLRRGKFSIQEDFRLADNISLRRPDRGNIKVVGAVAGVVALVVLLNVWWWVFCRIEIDSGKIGILTAKSGKNLPSGDIIAVEPGYKGIQLDTLPPGRHFRNPIFWDWEIVDLVEIPAGHVGVRIRYYGKDFTEEDLLAGRVIAGPDQKGIVREVMSPGQRYAINPYAESVEVHRAVEIPAGMVGVVTNYGGQETDRLPDAEIDEAKEEEVAQLFLVEPGQKGVVRQYLTPGVHYLNPYLERVHVMDTRSQKFEMSGVEAVRYPTSDAFDMSVDLTVKWRIKIDRAPEVFVRIGELSPDMEHNEILQKVIIPTVRGVARIEGSKYTALDYIMGDSRQKFQDSLFERIKAVCEPKGIEIMSVLINDFVPPVEIARPVTERVVADEELSRNRNQILQARSEQALARSEELAELERQTVAARTKMREKVIDVQGRQRVALIDQERRLIMEKTFLEAARQEAAATVARGKANSEVILQHARAEADTLKMSVEAFGGADNLAYYELVTKLAPSISSLFENTDGIFGGIFRELLPAGRR